MIRRLRELIDTAETTEDILLGAFIGFFVALVFMALLSLIWRKDK